MRVFYGFMIVFVSAILFMIPIDQGVYDFRTNIKQDTFFTQTTAGTTANVTLTKAVFDNDTTTIAITSDLFSDTPGLVAYNSTNRKTDISGLSLASNRTLTVAYDYDVLSASDAISALLDKIPWIWLLCVIAFAPCALVAMLVKRD